MLLAAAYCQEHGHSYNLQTVVKHEEPKKIEHIPVHTYNAAPSHEYYSGGYSQDYSHDQSHGHAVSSQSIIRHDSGHHQEVSQGDAHHYIVPVHHEVAPVHEIVSIKAAPSIEIHSGGETHGHGHAVSSQSIIRHDSGHHEQSHGGSQYIVAAPVHQTVSLHSAPIHEIHSAGQSNGHGHAVSSQSIIRHDSGHKEESYGQDSHYLFPIKQHSAPIHTVSLHSAPSQEISSESHGHAISSQNIIRHESHKSNEGSEHYVIPVQHHVAPIHHTVIQAAPIQHHYAYQSGHQEQSHNEESHHVDYYVS